MQVPTLDNHSLTLHITFIPEIYGKILSSFNNIIYIICIMHAINNVIFAWTTCTSLLFFAFCPKRFLNQMIFKVVSGVTWRVPLVKRGYLPLWSTRTPGLLTSLEYPNSLSNFNQVCVVFCRPLLVFAVLFLFGHCIVLLRFMTSDNPFGIFRAVLFCLYVTSYLVEVGFNKSVVVE